MLDPQKVKEDDELVLHSENGLDYRVSVVSVNPFRPPEEEFAVDIYDPNGTHYPENGDVAFVGAEFISKCSFVEE